MVLLGGQRDCLEGLEDERFGAHWPTVSIGYSDGDLSGSNQVVTTADLLAPHGERSAELRNAGRNNKIVASGRSGLEGNFDLGNDELEALNLQHIEANSEVIECVDSADLEVGDVHCVIDVVVRIELVKTNTVWSHVRWHQVTVTCGHGRNHRRNRN